MIIAIPTLVWREKNFPMLNVDFVWTPKKKRYTNLMWFKIGLQSYRTVKWLCWLPIFSIFNWSINLIQFNYKTKLQISTWRQTLTNTNTLCLTLNSTFSPLTLSPGYPFLDHRRHHPIKYTGGIIGSLINYKFILQPSVICPISFISYRGFSFFLSGYRSWVT